MRISTLILLVALTSSMVHVARAQKPTPYQLRKCLTIHAGAGFPSGDFGSSTSDGAGYAQPGFAIGLEYTSELEQSAELGCELTGYVLGFDNTGMANHYKSLSGSNNVTVDGSEWVIISGFVTLGVNGEVSPFTRLYLRGKLGGMIGDPPSLSLRIDGTKYVGSTAAGVAVAYGFGTGIILGNTVDLGVHFFAAQPEYQFSTTTTGNLLLEAHRFIQPTALWQLRLGYSFSFK